MVIGGAKASYSAGLAAKISGKRLIPVGCFGGAGEELLRVLESVSGNEKGAELQMLRGPWSDLTLQTTLRLMGFDDYPRTLIIHGRTNDWVSLKDYLQNALHVPEPIVMGQKFGDGGTLPEKFEDLASDVDAAIGLATPDDVGGLGIDVRGRLMGQQRIRFGRRARQNVWLEMGWFWGSLGRSRIMILCRGKIELPSDLQGVELYFYGKEPRERGDQIRLFIDKLRG